VIATPFIVEEDESKSELQACKVPDPVFGKAMVTVAAVAPAVTALEESDAPPEPAPVNVKLFALTAGNTFVDVRVMVIVAV
jgi:hypothetical protein